MKVRCLLLVLVLFIGCINAQNTTAPPTTAAPTTVAPTTAAPTTAAPTNATNTTTVPPTTVAPTTLPPTTAAPTNASNATTAAPTTVGPTTVAPTTLPPTTLPPTAPPLTNASTYVDFHITETGNYSLITNTSLYCSDFIANISIASHTSAINYVCLNISAGSIILDIRYISSVDITPQLYNYILGNISAMTFVTAASPICNTSVTYDTGHPCYVAPATTVAPTTAAPTTLPPTTVAPTTAAPTTAAPVVNSTVVLGSSGISTSGWIIIGVAIPVLLVMFMVIAIVDRSTGGFASISPDPASNAKRLSTYDSTEPTRARLLAHVDSKHKHTSDSKKARISSLFDCKRSKN